MVGRLHSAWRAVELGFDIEADAGPSGHLRHWRIVGIPDPVCDLFSKRSDDIAEHLARTGQTSYRARGIAARATRSVKRHTGVDELLPTWQHELAELGWPVKRLVAHLAQSQEQTRALRFPLSDAEIDRLAREVLDVDGRLLANHKIFTRTQLIAELAPRLYGRSPAELDRVLERIVASQAVVPLIGVAGVREQAYTTVEVLTAEATITRVVETLANRPGPAIAPKQIAAAIDKHEQALGHRLTAGQRKVIEHVCGNGRAVSVVIGVAGSGKTTALDTVTALLERAGYRVVGTSTSGQAARTLATEAHLDATTFASLLWRLDHGLITLDARTVVVVDETGMADDANLARLTLAAKHAHASLVLVGDHHQLGAVGPGGALAALLDRHPDLTVTLDHNVRQHDPAERHALAELRDGSVAAAIDWYATTGRIGTRPDRVATLAAMAEAWADDINNGHDSALFAWRRADVGDLNRLARHHWDQHGRLRGDDVEVAPGRWYAVGDRLVALAPNPTAGIVTSEQLTITAIDETRISARTSHGRTVLITGVGLDTDNLDYGYTLTVHRAQGTTVDRAHVLAAGGGRELAYVALSRARDHTRIYATADNLEQAVDDLHADWGVERRQRWITDTAAQPGHAPEPQLPTRPTDQPPIEMAPGQQRAVARAHLAALEDDYRQLRAGIGRWAETPEGHAARTLTEAKEQLQHAHRRAHDPALRRRDRRAATKTLPELEREVAHAQQRHDAVCTPANQGLQASIREARTDVERLDAQAVIRRIERLRQQPPTPSLGPDLGISL